MSFFGGSTIPKSEEFCENQKCSLGPKMQNKQYFFVENTGFQKGGRGVQHLGKIPKKSLSFFGCRLLVHALLPIGSARLRSDFYGSRADIESYLRGLSRAKFSRKQQPAKHQSNFFFIKTKKPSLAVCPGP